MSRVLPVSFQFELAYHPGNLISFVLEKQRRRKKPSAEISISQDHQEFLRNFNNRYPDNYDRIAFKECKKKAARAAAAYDPEYEMAFPPSARQTRNNAAGAKRHIFSRDHGEMVDLAVVGQAFEGGPSARVRPVASRYGGLPPSKAPRLSSGLGKRDAVESQNVITVPIQEEYLPLECSGTKLDEAEAAANTIMSMEPENVQQQQEIFTGIDEVLPPSVSPEFQTAIQMGTRIPSHWNKPQERAQGRKLESFQERKEPTKIHYKIHDSTVLAEPSIDYATHNETYVSENPTPVDYPNLVIQGEAQQRTTYVSHTPRQEIAFLPSSEGGNYVVQDSQYRSIGKANPPARTTFRYTILPGSTSSPQRLIGSASGLEDRYALHSNLKSRTPASESSGRIIYHNQPRIIYNNNPAVHQASRKQNLQPYADGNQVHQIYASPTSQPGVRKMFIIRPMTKVESQHPPDPKHSAPRPATPPLPWWKKEEEQLWSLVLGRLPRKTLMESGMLVSKLWKGIVEQRLEDLWTEVDLSGSHHTLTSEIFTSVARKKPKRINLSWTGASRADVEILVSQNDKLESMSLAGCHWSAVEGVKKSKSDLISLDLRWVQGCSDGNFKRLVSEARKLKLLEELFMSQCDIGDATVRLIANQFSRIRKLDLSYCGKITNVAIEVMGAAGSPARHSIRHLNLANCHNLNSDIFIALNKLPALAVVDVRACPDIAEARCVEFQDASRALGRDVTVLV